MNKRGRLIAVEGLDGVGTTTQSQRISAGLRARGYRVVETREPSAGPVGGLIRLALEGRLALAQGGAMSEATMGLLFAADRADHIASVVEPALASGAWVVTDRYVLSNFGYQGSMLGFGWVAGLNAHAPKADLTLYLTVPARVARRRLATRGGLHERYDNPTVQLRVRRGYATALRRYGVAIGPVVHLDAQGAIEEVTEAALGAIRDRFERQR